MKMRIDLSGLVNTLAEQVMHPLDPYWLRFEDHELIEMFDYDQNQIGPNYDEWDNHLIFLLYDGIIKSSDVLHSAVNVAIRIINDTLNEQIPESYRAFAPGEIYAVGDYVYDLVYPNEVLTLMHGVPT